MNGSGGISSLNGPHGVIVSPDGAHVYVASAVSNSVTVFSRNATTGTLSLVAAYVDGSGGITSLAAADGYIVVPDNVELLEKGEEVEVVLF